MSFLSRQSRRPWPALLLVAPLSLGPAAILAGCGADDDTETSAGPAGPASDEAVEETSASPAAAPTISDPWTREPAAGQTGAAVYGVLTNPGVTDLQVVAASSPVTDAVELHETVTDDEGVMSMEEREDGFVVPAGGELIFEPGGPHIMLLDVDPEAYPDPVEVTLELEGLDPLTFDAEVRAIAEDAAAGEGEGNGEMSEPEGGAAAQGIADIDFEPLHDVDDQLTAGTLEAEAQRAVVAPCITAVEALDPVDGSPEAELLGLLVQLDTALAAGDVPTAAPLATAAHGLAHSLQHGGH